MKHISPTQISMYRECPRKWGYAYIEKRKITTNAQQIGLATHKELDTYWETNNFDLEKILVLDKIYYPGRIAYNILEYDLEKPDETEKEFIWKFQNLIFRGIVDYRRGNVIKDYKTSKNPDRWAKSQKNLLTDPQAILYSAYTALIKRYEAIEFELIYLNTNWKKKTNKRIKVKWTKEQVLNQLQEHIIPTAREIQAQYQNNDIKLTKQTTSACNNFGGCPYMSLCWGEKGLINVGTNALLEKVKKAKGKKSKATKKEIKPPVVIPEEATDEAIDEATEEATEEGTEEEETPKKRGPKPGSKRGRKARVVSSHPLAGIYNEVVKAVGQLAPTTERIDVLMAMIGENE